MLLDIRPMFLDRDLKSFLKCTLQKSLSNEENDLLSRDTTGLVQREICNSADYGIQLFSLTFLCSSH